MERRCLILSEAPLSTRTFNCSTVSGSDLLVHRSLRWNKVPRRRETYVHPRDLLLLHFLCSGKSETTNLSEGGSDTPGGHGTDSSDSLVSPTYVRAHMPTNISYTVNVKM